MLKQCVPEGLHPIEKTHTEAAGEELQPLEKFVRGCLLLKVPPCGTGDVCEGPPEEEKQQRKGVVS